MIKETVTYKDFNDVERTEDLYFHLSDAEILEMEMSVSGGFSEMIQRIVNAQDQPAIIKVFKELLLKAYGIKSPDGRRFEKSEELSAAFSQTEAYSKLFMKLALDHEYAAKFINGIMPAETAERAKNANVSDVIDVPAAN